MANPEYRHLYAKRAWQRKARAQRQKEPLCRHCLQHGIVTPAAHADHIEPHRGDEYKFWHGELQSLCLECHSIKTQEELGKKGKRRVSVDGTPDGWV